MSFEELLRKGPFGTVVADPPWDFDNKGSRSAAVKHYPTMSVKEICRLPVKEIARRKAHLYLWVTDGHLFAAAQVMSAWGFDYKQTLSWVKLNGTLQIGLGNYFRHAHEICLFATRGGAPARRHDLPSVILQPRGAHSQKPEELQRRAEALSPAPYLELFARRQRRGWTCWGDELGRTA